VKGATSGSIRPIVLTYEATRPMIPIKLTAVAANDDMGVLTWVLSEAQAVPKNYSQGGATISRPTLTVRSEA
jgi:hypothetical protein